MKGEVVYLYAFDVANEIAIKKIGQIAAGKPFPFQFQTHRAFPKDIPLYKPLAIKPPPLDTTLGGQGVDLLIRVYEVGVVSITMQVSFEVETLAQLRQFHNPRLANGTMLDAAARELCVGICANLKDVMTEGCAPPEPEAYTVFCLKEVDAVTDANGWLARHRVAVAELLTDASPGTLSEMQTAEVLRITRSYANTDLVVIDWDAALAIELGGSMDDVLYVLELANLQLEEYRVMDERLDRYLEGAYDDLKRRRLGLFGASSATLGKLRLFRVDVTKLTDEVTHISKFFGDWHLARVYLGAAERFYLNQWRQSVENRLSQLDQLYTVVNSDINSRRMVWLEVLVVIFFAIDLVMLAFWRR